MNRAEGEVAYAPGLLGARIGNGRMRRLWVVAVAFAVIGSPCASAQTPLWVAEERGETPDPAIHYGELANGLRYAVMRSAEPKGVAVVEYHIAVGTAQQSANEKEFAHLVEHMAFGATTTFPKGDAIAQLQSAGLQLGVMSTARLLRAAQCTAFRSRK